MRGFITVFVAVLVSVVALVLYDAHKYFTSSWAVRLYFIAYQTNLNRFAETFATDASVDSVGFFMKGKAGVALSEGSTLDEAAQEQLALQYEKLLRATHPNPFLVICTAWFKAKAGGRPFCTGTRHRLLMVMRGAAGPNYLLSYWPDGVGETQACRRPSDRTISGGCDMPLAERWTIRYDWFPSLKDY